MKIFLSSAFFITALLSICAALPCDKPSYSLPWEHVGPGGYVNKGSLLQPASAGAAQAAVRLNGTSWMIATANGGIWKTPDLLATPEPHWSQVLDNQRIACTSISAMESNGSTVLAGCGPATSSEMGWDWNVANAGDWAGVMVSHDAGDSWAMTAFPENYFVTAFVVRSPTSFVVSARSHFYRRDDGGVWVTSDGGVTWTRTLVRPVYDLALEPSSGILLAALPWTDDSDVVLASPSGGAQSDWMPFSSGLNWDGRTPFYPTFALGMSVVFIGALTVNPSQLSDTASAIYQRPIADLLSASKSAKQNSDKGWLRVAGGPSRLDKDGMPKDRMALLVHPHDEDIIFVAGNADALVWRVFWRAGTWVVSAGKNDTMDGSAPHADCRRYFWEPISNSLILLSDGGAFLRELPDEPGGRWRSLSGDTGAMEFVSADWDPVGKRWVGGAQDNSIQVAPINTSSTSRALGVISGDGAVTAVDASPSSPRLWGATQNLGNIVDDDGPERQLSNNDDDNCTGFGFYEQEYFMCVPLLRWFTVSQFRYFVQPFALLSNDPAHVFLFASGTKIAPSGIYHLHVPYGIKDLDNLADPVLEVPVDGVQIIVAGGITAGKPDPSVLVAMNATALLHRSSKHGSTVMVRALPQQYAEPVIFDYPTSNTYTLGPCSHDRTISLAVSPADSSLLAISGWTNLLDNSGTEKVWVSKDAGASFIDVTYNLREATGTIGQVRPSALLLVPVTNAHALLVGTVSGVFVFFLGKAHEWRRLGNFSAFPLVLVAGLSYQPQSDTIVAASMGRGVYVVHGASQLLDSLSEHSTNFQLDQARFI